MNGEELSYELDEQIAVGALVRLAAEYVRAGHRYVFLADFRNQVVPQLLQQLAHEEAGFVVLTFSDESRIPDRVTNPDRPSGYRDVEAAVEANRWLMDQTLPGALKIDVSSHSADVVAEKIARRYGLLNRSVQRKPLPDTTNL